MQSWKPVVNYYTTDKLEFYNKNGRVQPGKLKQKNMLIRFRKENDIRHVFHYA